MAVQQRGCRTRRPSASIPSSSGRGLTSALGSSELSSAVRADNQPAHVRISKLRLHVAWCRRVHILHWLLRQGLLRRGDGAAAGDGEAAAGGGVCLLGPGAGAGIQARPRVRRFPTPPHRPARLLQLFYGLYGSAQGEAAATSRVPCGVSGGARRVGGQRRAAAYAPAGDRPDRGAHVTSGRGTVAGCTSASS